MGNKDNPHRETLRAALGIIQTAKTLDQARTQLTQMLDDLDRREARGVRGDAAVAGAEERPAIAPVPKTSAADARPVRRRRPESGPGPGRTGPA